MTGSTMKSARGKDGKPGNSTRTPTSDGMSVKWTADTRANAWGQYFSATSHMAQEAADKMAAPVKALEAQVDQQHAEVTGRLTVLEDSTEAQMALIRGLQSAFGTLRSLESLTTAYQALATGEVAKSVEAGKSAKQAVTDVTQVVSDVSAKLGELEQLQSDLGAFRATLGKEIKITVNGEQMSFTVQEALSEILRSYTSDKLDVRVQAALNNLFVNGVELVTGFDAQGNVTTKKPANFAEAINMVLALPQLLATLHSQNVLAVNTRFAQLKRETSAQLSIDVQFAMDSAEQKLSGQLEAAMVELRTLVENARSLLSQAQDETRTAGDALQEALRARDGASHLDETALTHAQSAQSHKMAAEGHEVQIRKLQGEISQLEIRKMALAEAIETAERKASEHSAAAARHEGAIGNLSEALQQNVDAAVQTALGSLKLSEEQVRRIVADVLKGLDYTILADQVVESPKFGARIISRLHGFLGSVDQLLTGQETNAGVTLDNVPTPKPVSETALALVGRFLRLIKYGTENAAQANQTATEAQKTASEAKTTAGNAQKTADVARTTSESAQKTADAAKEVAEKATHDGGVTRDIALGAALGNEGYNMGDVASAVVQAECDELQNKPQK